MEKMLFDAANVEIVGIKEPDEETLKEISPALHVSENTPPIILWSTSNDTLVQYSTP